MEANARWNEERRDAAKIYLRRIVDKTGLSNPELRKEMIYSWEKGYIEDKEQENTQSTKKTVLRKNELRKSGQALTKSLKGKYRQKQVRQSKRRQGQFTENWISRSSKN